MEVSNRFEALPETGNIESKWENRELTINTDEELAKFVEIEETRYNEDSEIEQHYKYR